MQELLNLKDWQKEYLSMLKKGQCLIRVNSIEKPFAMATEHVKRSWLSDEEIIEKNEEILEQAEKQKETQKKGMLSRDKKVETKSFCKFCGKEIEMNADYCELCSVKLEEEDKKVEEFDRLIDKLLLTEGFFEGTDKDKE